LKPMMGEYGLRITLMEVELRLASPYRSINRAARFCL
jgi:hypothetical protein